MGERIPAPRGSAAVKYEGLVRELAMSYPEAHEDRPWGERAIKVRRKTFLFLTTNQDGLHLSVKLPTSRHEALLLPFAEPTGYGLGKSGWVSAHFAVDQVPPMAVLDDWIAESYAAIAPKKLAALGRPAPKTKKKARRKKA